MDNLLEQKYIIQCILCTLDRNSAKKFITICKRSYCYKEFLFNKLYKKKDKSIIDLINDLNTINLFKTQTPINGKNIQIEYNKHLFKNIKSERFLKRMHDKILNISFQNNRSHYPNFSIKFTNFEVTIENKISISYRSNKTNDTKIKTFKINIKNTYTNYNTYFETKTPNIELIPIRYITEILAFLEFKTSKFNYIYLCKYLLMLIDFTVKIFFSESTLLIEKYNVGGLLRLSDFNFYDSKNYNRDKWLLKSNLIFYKSGCFNYKDYKKLSKINWESDFNLNDFDFRYFSIPMQEK